MTASSYVLFDADGKAVNRILLNAESDWRPPDGHTIQPDPDGAVWAVAQEQDAPPPEPDWSGFRNAILTSDVLDAALASQGSAPAALLALPTALEAAQAGDTSYLTTCLNRVVEMGIIPPEAGEVFVQAAEAAHLPAEVVELLTAGEPTGEPSAN